MSLDLSGVEAFVAVARWRHFGQAAQELGVTVSAVTKRLQRLEAELGVPLVLRDSAGFSGLTPAGQRLIEVAPELLHAARVVTEIAQGEPLETLRVAVPAGVGVVAPLLPAALGTLEIALQHNHPGVAVLAVPTAFERLSDSLTGGAVDMVLTFGPSPEAQIASVRLSPLRRIGLVAAGHPFARREAMPAAEFARQPMIYTPGLPDHYMHPFVLADVRPLGQARLVAIKATNTAHVALRLLQGQEVTVVPLALTANLPPELAKVQLRGLPDSWYYVHHRVDDQRPELRTAIELMGEFTESMIRAASR